jgi:excisionase family DNA binding protein
MKRDFLTIEEAAASAGRSASTIWRWVREGDLRAYDVRGRTRVRESDLLELLEPEAFDDDDDGQDEDRED